MSKILQLLQKFSETSSWQKSLIALVLLGLIGGGLYATGIFPFHSSERDCNSEPNYENAVVIKMENNSLDPKEITINVCETLLFLNLDDTTKHPMIQKLDEGKDVGKLGYYQLKVTRVGSYSFYDQLHKDIIGKITIKDTK
jgi:plastocyanin